MLYSNKIKTAGCLFVKACEKLAGKQYSTPAIINCPDKLLQNAILITRPTNHSLNVVYYLRNTQLQLFVKFSLLIMITLFFISCSQFRYKEHYKGYNENNKDLSYFSKDGFILAAKVGDFLSSSIFLVRSDIGGKKIVILEQNHFKASYTYRHWVLERTDSEKPFVGDGAALGFFDREIIFTCLSQDSLFSIELEPVEKVKSNPELKYNLNNMKDNFDLLLKPETQYDFEKIKNDIDLLTKIPLNK